MLPTIAQHARNHGITPNKKLGQNFLYDLSLCAKIAQQAGTIQGKTIIEIGPGVAGLSRAILECNPQQLIVIEKDRRCITLLEEIKQLYPQLIIINQDAMKLQFAELAAQYKFQQAKIISNLPYNIGTKLLVGWLQSDLEFIESITVMLQKEVVERALAEESNKNYGRLSIWCSLLTEARKCFDVAPSAFYPPPKVSSSILHLTPKNRHKLDASLHKSLHAILAAAFSARRKLFKKTLRSITQNTEQLFLETGLKQDVRPDQISPEQYLQLAQLINGTKA